MFSHAVACWYRHQAKWLVHCVTTALLSQARIHYYWYKKQRALCHMQPVCDMGGFTRLLHTGEADDLMDEIPTVSDGVWRVGW
jgi:hypothetical protein